jgi:hypothetical protein
MAINYGDLPTWLASGWDRGRLGAALWQIRTERNQRHEQEARDRELARREQARRISCWPEMKVLPDRWVHSEAVPLRSSWSTGRTSPSTASVFALVHVQGTAGFPRIEDWAMRVAPPPRSTTVIPPAAGGSGCQGRAWTRTWICVWVRRSPSPTGLASAGCGAAGCPRKPPKPPLDYFADFRLEGPHQLQMPQQVG